MNKEIHKEDLRKRPIRFYILFSRSDPDIPSTFLFLSTKHMIADIIILKFLLKSIYSSLLKKIICNSVTLEKGGNKQNELRKKSSLSIQNLVGNDERIIHINKFTVIQKDNDTN